MNKPTFTIQDSMQRKIKYENYKFIFENNIYVSLWQFAFETGLYQKFNNDYFFTVYWKFNDIEHKITFPNGNAHFLVDPNSNLIICRWFIIDNQLTDITHFLNMDGTINHKLKLPEVVYCRLEDGLKIPHKPLIPSTTDDMTKIGSFPVEDIPATMNFNEELNSLVGQYYYIYDWILYRKYDAIRQEWGDIVGHSGHAG